MSAEARVAALGIDLPTKVRRGAGLVPTRRHRDLLFVSGHGPEDNDGNLLFHGQLGAEVTIEQGYQAARATGVQLLRSVGDVLGSLDNVEYVVKALGFVNSAPGFFEQPAVMHGFSDLMTEVSGERGRADGPHHRVATCPFASTWLHRPGQPGAAQSYAGGWEARYRTTATARASRTSASAASSTSTPRVRLGRGGPRSGFFVATSGLRTGDRYRCVVPVSGSECWSVTRRESAAGGLRGVLRGVPGRVPSGRAGYGR